ncbi:MAG: hypothetical protein ACRDLY_01910, partial [Thermoleophilaceae bacterium]
MAAKLSVPLTARLGTKVVVAAGLALVGVALGAFTAVGVDTPYFTKVAGALRSMGTGMGSPWLRPRTRSWDRSRRPRPASLGDERRVREVGGTLGVAVLGSVVSTSYASSMEGATAGLPAGAAEAASDSVGGALGRGGDRRWRGGQARR